MIDSPLIGDTPAHYALYFMAVPAWIFVAGLMFVVLRDWWRSG
jgi:hypothetical protein